MVPQLLPGSRSARAVSGLLRSNADQRTQQWKRSLLDALIVYNAQMLRAERHGIVAGGDGGDQPWSELTKLWRNAAQVPAYRVENAIVRAMTSLRDLIGGSYAFFLFGLLEPAPRLRRSLRQILSWRPCAILRDPDEPMERIAVRERWIAELDYVHDQGTFALIAGAGTPRAFTHRELAPPGTWEGSPSCRLLQRLGASSRLLVAVPLLPTLEAVMGFDRQSPSPPFEDREKRTAVTALSGLTPRLRQLARLYGLESGDPLTDREREILCALLTGAGEQQVAAQVGMTWRSAHARVAHIYRKLGVTTRAELMACFLKGASDDAESSPADIVRTSQSRTPLKPKRRKATKR